MARTKRVDVSKLTPDQRAALAQLIRDARTVAPQFEEMKLAATATYQKWLQSPKWYPNQAPGNPPDESWTGAPEVNYVESFEQ